MRLPINPDAVALLGGFVLWSLAFVLLYGGHGLICAVDLPGPLDGRATLIVLWVAMIAAHAALLVWLVRRRKDCSEAGRFISSLALILAVASMVATIWTGLPIITLGLC